MFPTFFQAAKKEPSSTDPSGSNSLVHEDGTPNYFTVSKNREGKSILSFFHIPPVIAPIGSNPTTPVDHLQQSKQAQHLQTVNLLKNYVFRLCQFNTNNMTGLYPDVISLEELFYARSLFKILFEDEDESKSMTDQVDPSRYDQGYDDSYDADYDNGSNYGNYDDGTTLQKTYSLDDGPEFNKKAAKTQILQQLGLHGQPPVGLREIYKAVEEDQETIDKIKENKTCLEKGLVPFSALTELFQPGTYVVGRTMDSGVVPVGFRVGFGRFNSWTLLTGERMRSFQFQLQFVLAAGKDEQFGLVTVHDGISEYVGLKTSRSFSYVMMDDEMKAKLTTRGKEYVRLSNGHHFLAYHTESFSLHANMEEYQSGTQISIATFLNAKGRVMIDLDVGRRLNQFPCSQYSKFGTAIQTFLQQFHQQAQMNQHSLFGNPNQTQQTEVKKGVPDAKLCLCWPVLTGFSFSAKTWGHVVIDGLSPIQFDDKAFDQLVIDPDRKQLIHALVLHSQGLFKDIISGKGGGSVFLLHGPPGTGKTLTAEAVAEMLHKPMYSVTMGELGTTPEGLERKLGKILDLATVWKALVLLDECDIFLERRGQKEILRNSMVGVLLRQIEYFQGVLFLTSNRVSVMDAAFHSRVTVGLKYDPLDDVTREAIWKNLLTASSVQGIDTKRMSSVRLNGRQIKNCIALAQGLAQAEKRPVNQNHIDKTVQICLTFNQEMKQEFDNPEKDVEL